MAGNRVAGEEGDRKDWRGRMGGGENGKLTFLYEGSHILSSFSWAMSGHTTTSP